MEIIFCSSNMKHWEQIKNTLEASVQIPSFMLARHTERSTFDVACHLTDKPIVK